MERDFCSGEPLFERIDPLRLRAYNRLQKLHIVLQLLDPRLRRHGFQKRPLALCQKLEARHDRIFNDHLHIMYSAAPRDVADPWYTDDFEAAYRDIEAGCRALLVQLSN